MSGDSRRCMSAGFAPSLDLNDDPDPIQCWSRRNFASGSAVNSSAPEYSCSDANRRRLRDRLARFEISQNCETSNGPKEVLERMSAQNEIRMDCMVVELEELGDRIKRRRDGPVECAGIFRLEQH